MAPIKMSQRERLLVVVTLAAALFYVFYTFILTPIWLESDKLGADLSKLRLDLKVAENKIKILETVEKKFGEIKEEKQLPVASEERALEVLRALAQTTTDSKLKLISIKPIVGKGETLKFDLVCSGRYNELYDFLEILHGLRVLILIDSLNVIGKGGAEPILDIRMALTAHF